MTSSRWKRISILCKAGALCVMPSIYIIKWLAAAPSAPLSPAPVVSAVSDPKVVQMLNETTALTYRLNDSFGASSLGAAISSNPAWLLIAVGLAAIALVIDWGIA